MKLNSPFGLHFLGVWKQVHIWVISYHLASDCGLQRIHQLSSDFKETTVVHLQLAQSFQVGHVPVLTLHQLLMKVLHHFCQEKKEIASPIQTKGQKNPQAFLLL